MPNTSDCHWPRTKQAGKSVEWHGYRTLHGVDLLQEKVLKHRMSTWESRI
jgi:hypothetical protein